MSPLPPMTTIFMIASLSFDLCISNLPIVLAKGLDAFEGHRMLIAYYFMWHAGHPAPECSVYMKTVRAISGWEC